MTFHCPRCSEFVAENATGCQACGADFLQLGWKPTPSPIDTEIGSIESGGKHSAGLILSVLLFPALLLLLGGLLVAVALFGGGVGSLLFATLLLVLAGACLVWAIRSGIRVFKK